MKIETKFDIGQTVYVGDPHTMLRPEPRIILAIVVRDSGVSYGTFQSERRDFDCVERLIRESDIYGSQAEFHEAAASYAQVLMQRHIEEGQKAVAQAAV